MRKLTASMDCSLTLGYEFSRDGDDFGWLISEVETPDVSGRNGMWVQWQDVVEFAQSLAAYPIAEDRPIIREWGFGEGDKYEIVTRISIAPEGRTGGLIVDLRLAITMTPPTAARPAFDRITPRSTGSVARLRR